MESINNFNFINFSLAYKINLPRKNGLNIYNKIIQTTNKSHSIFLDNIIIKIPIIINIIKTEEKNLKTVNIINIKLINTEKINLTGNNITFIQNLLNLFTLLFLNILFYILTFILILIYQK